MATSQAVRVGATGNLFLDSLSPDSAACLVRGLKRLGATTGSVIAHAGAEITHIVFPVSGVISTVTRMEDGANVEVTVIGREGFYGIQVALGDNRSGYEAVVQIPGTFL